MYIYIYTYYHTSYQPSSTHALVRSPAAFATSLQQNEIQCDTSIETKCHALTVPGGRKFSKSARHGIYYKNSL